MKNVGTGAIRSIVTARENGPFVSLFDFCERVDSRLVNRKVIDSLVKAGAFDYLETPRSQLFAMLDEAIEHGNRMQKLTSEGQLSIFPAGAKKLVPTVNKKAIESLPEWTDVKLLMYEKDMLGVYFSGHPLEKYLSVIRLYSSTSIARMKEVREGKKLWLGGILTSIKRTTTKRGGRMAIAQMEDLDGKVEVVFYPKSFETCAPLIRNNAVVFVRGRAEHRMDEVKLVAEEIASLNDIAEKLTKMVEIDIPLPADSGKLEALKEMMGHEGGDCSVYLNLRSAENGNIRIKANGMTLNPSLERIQELKTLFGDYAIHLGG